MNYKIEATIYGRGPMHNRRKPVSHNTISSRQISRKYRSLSRLEFAEGILAKYRMRRKSGQILKFVFRATDQTLNTVRYMEDRSFFNNYFRIHLHFQGERNDKTDYFLQESASRNNSVRTLVCPRGNRILINRFKEDHYFQYPMGNGIALQKVFLIPDNSASLASPARSNPAIASSVHQSIAVFHLPTMEIHPRRQPISEILSWKRHFNSGKFHGSPSEESSRMIRAGIKNRIIQLALSPIQIREKTAAKRSRNDQTLVATEIPNTTPAKQPSRNLTVFPGKREDYVYRSFPGQTGRNHRETLTGIKAGFSGTVSRQKAALSKNEFVWRKPADTNHNPKITPTSAGVAQIRETITKVTSVSENYPTGAAPKAVPEINTIVAEVLKSLDKRIAIERDKRGRR